MATGLVGFWPLCGRPAAMGVPAQEIVGISGWTRCASCGHSAYNAVCPCDSFSANHGECQLLEKEPTVQFLHRTCRQAILALAVGCLLAVPALAHPGSGIAVDHNGQVYF